MAEVFRVKAFGVEGFQKTFALKRILPHISEDPEFITMFIDEAKIASRLHHGNICQIYEFGRVGDFYFQLMEYIAGFDLRTLKEKMDEANQKLPLSFLLHVIARGCEGLDYAHRKTDSSGNPLNIIHRDVSPQNLMISYEGTTKLIDFGIAKAKSRASKTQAGVIKGKFAYMPPELLRGEPIDGRADVFSLGIVLHELLTGQGLFDRETDLDTLRAVMAAEVPVPSSIDPSIPDFVDKVVLKALTAHPAERYANAEDFGEDLERAVMMTGQPMSSNKVRKFMVKMFPSFVQAEQDKAQHFATFSETGEVALKTGRVQLPPQPKTVETFSGRRLKKKRAKVRGADGFTEEVTYVHGTKETGESDYEEDDLQAKARPDSADAWQQEEGYDDAFDADELEEVEGILLDDADELDFMDEPTSVRMKAQRTADGAPVLEVDVAELAQPLLTDADLDDGEFLDEADLIEEGEILDGEDLLEEVETTGAFAPEPVTEALAPAPRPAEPDYDPQQYAEGEYEEGEYEEGEYEEGEYAEGEYAEGEYAEGEYAEGEYAEGEYEEGEYEEGEYAEGEYEDQPAQGQPAQGQPAQGQYEEGEYAEGEYAEGEYEEGEYAEGEYEEGEYEEGEYAEGEYAEGEYAEGEYAEGEYEEGEYAEGEYAEGEYAEGEYEGQPAQGQPAQGQYEGGEYEEGEYAEGEYAEGEYEEGEYAEGEYAEGEYAAAQPPGGGQPAYEPAPYAEQKDAGYADSPYEDDEGVFEPIPSAPAAPEAYVAPPQAAPAPPPPAPAPVPAPEPAPGDEDDLDGDPLHDGEDATMFDGDAADAIRAKFAEMLANANKSKSNESEVMELGDDDLEVVDD